MSDDEAKTSFNKEKVPSLTEICLRYCGAPFGKVAQLLYSAGCIDRLLFCVHSEYVVLEMKPN